MRGIMGPRGPVLGANIWIAVALLIAATSRPVSAQILTRTTLRPSENWNPILPLTLGAGFEFETNGDERQYFTPLLVEYNFTPFTKLSIEPTFGYIDDPDVQAGGFGDLDGTMEWEFLRERRYRPALTAFGGIKFPTAVPSDVGSPGWDYSLGLIASKDFVFTEVDLSGIYIFSGDKDQQDTLELTLAGEIPLTHRLAIEFEGVGSVGRDILSGQNGGDGAGFDYEGTLGLGWQVTRFIKLEGGATLKNDLTQEYTFGLVYNFSGEY